MDAERIPIPDGCTMVEYKACLSYIFNESAQMDRRLFDDCTIERSHMSCLQQPDSSGEYNPLYALNDHVLSHYTSQLAAIAQTTSNGRIMVQNTNFLQFMETTPAKVFARWNVGGLSNMDVLGGTLDSIFAIYHVGNHWKLLEINIKYKELRVYDSLPVSKCPHASKNPKSQCNKLFLYNHDQHPQPFSAHDCNTQKPQEHKLWSS